MSGKCKSTTVPGLSVYGVAITFQCDVANALAASFASVSTSDRYDSTFLRIKDNAEKSPLHFNSQNLECYDAPFSMDELLAICRSRNTSPGPAGIHNQMLPHLSPSAKEFLLSLCNRIWEEHCFPFSWREGIVIPILKVGKDHFLPSSYRPICLTSCVCKTMERMVNDRLVFILEKENLLAPA
jgi:potassium voltage-gated channel Eag-related subfamily H protein 8